MILKKWELCQVTCTCSPKNSRKFGAYFALHQRKERDLRLHSRSLVSSPFCANALSCFTRIEGQISRKFCHFVKKDLKNIITSEISWKILRFLRNLKNLKNLPCHIYRLICPSIRITKCERGANLKQMQRKKILPLCARITSEVGLVGWGQQLNAESFLEEYTPKTWAGE